MTSNHSLQSGAGLSGHRLTQKVFEMACDLRSRWRAGQPIPAEAYEAVFGPEIFARPEVGEVLHIAGWLAEQEAVQGPNLPPLSPEERLKLQQYGIDDTEFEPQGYPYFTPSQFPGHLGQFGHYEILSQVGHGGQGVVFHAQLPPEPGIGKGLPRDRALKLLIPEGDLHRGRLRLSREAQCLDGLRHDNIVRFFYARTQKIDSGGEIDFLEMEYVPGPTLADLLIHFQSMGQPAIPVPLTLTLLRQVTDGLTYLHAKGRELTHRDLKPGNILLEWRFERKYAPTHWRVRLCDLGLVIAEDMPGITSEGRFVGTWWYMSPEHFECVKDTESCKMDIFSLGVILYEMLIGKRPFEGTSRDEIMQKILIGKYAAPHEVNPAITGPLEKLIVEMLSHDPGLRPPAEEVLERLKEIQTNGWKKPSFIAISPNTATPFSLSARHKILLALLFPLAGLPLWGVFKPPPDKTFDRPVQITIRAIAGTVLDEIELGEQLPLAGAEVTLSGVTTIDGKTPVTKTDEFGHYTFDNLIAPSEVDLIDVRVTLAGYVPSPKTQQAPGDTQHTILLSR